jgi:arsenate reductase
MADGMAAAMAPGGVEVNSAGSAPTELRREAVDVLREIGIYIANHRAKGVDDINLDAVQLVVTLCAEEECPVVLKPIPRLSWALPDPAAEAGGHEARLDAFRAARDEIRRRLYLLFLG